MKSLVTLTVAAIALCCFLPQETEAQLFRRYRQAGCPNGQCPTAGPVRQAAVVVSQPVRRVATAVTAPIGGGHWTFPGNIDSHLQNTHGVSTSGMTYEQKLNLHDALHEGRTIIAPTRVVPAPIAPTTLKTTPTVAPPLPSSNTFGLGIPFEESVIEEDNLGQALADALSSNTIPKHILAQVDTTPQATSPVKVSESFKTSLLKAVTEARKNGKITLREAVRIRVACLSPAFLERAQELAVVQIASSGETSESVPYDENGVIQVEGINWEGLTKFLEVFIPLLIQMLKAFGL